MKNNLRGGTEHNAQYHHTNDKKCCDLYATHDLKRSRETILELQKVFCLQLISPTRGENTRVL